VLRIPLLTHSLRLVPRLAVGAVALLMIACTSPVKLGAQEDEARLKALLPVAGKVSLYICREEGRAGRGMRSTVIVDGTIIGMLLPNMFAHTTVDAGSHSVHLKKEAPVIPSSTSGEHTFSATAGEVVVLWVGVTGQGWGTLTIDDFDTQAEGRQCVAKASLAVIPD